MTTPVGLDEFSKSVAASASPNCTFGNNPSGAAVSNQNCWGTATNPTVTVVDGDLAAAGNPDGYGILLVTGTLYLSGDFSWHGVVLVIGNAGVTQMNGGGTGQIVGTMLVAKTCATASDCASGNLLPTLNSTPLVDWNGGGGNGIQYDHCYAENMLKQNCIYRHRPPRGRSPSLASRP